MVYSTYAGRIKDGLSLQLIKAWRRVPLCMSNVDHGLKLCLYGVPAQCNALFIIISFIAAESPLSKSHGTPI